MQRLFSWGDGFAVSNMATVNVKKQEDGAL